MNSQQEYEAAFRKQFISKFWLEAYLNSDINFGAIGASADGNQQEFEIPDPENIRFEYESAENSESVQQMKIQSTSSKIDV